MIYNESVLFKISSNSDDRDEILSDFLSETSSDIEKFNNAIRGSDFASLVRLAHSIKGASVMVGADELAEVCAQIEHAARRKVLPISVDLKATFCRLVQYLGRASGVENG